MCVDVLIRIIKYDFFVSSLVSISVISMPSVVYVLRANRLCLSRHPSLVTMRFDGFDFVR